MNSDFDLGLVNGLSEKEYRYYLPLKLNVRVILKPKNISPLNQSPVVSVINAFSLIGVALVKNSWKTCPPVSISRPRLSAFW